MLTQILHAMLPNRYCLTHKHYLKGSLKLPLQFQDQPILLNDSAESLLSEEKKRYNLYNIPGFFSNF